MGVETLLRVVQEDNSIKIVEASLTKEQAFYLTVTLVGRLADLSGMEYNEVCDALKEVEEESEDV